MTTMQRRRHQRGAAMVEAAVAIPFFITIFVALLFIGNLYVEKQRTISLSRQQAWAYALKNCEGSAPDVSSEDAGPVPSQGDMDLGGTGQFESAPGGNTASKGSRMATSTMKGQVSAKTQQKVFEQKIQTTTWVTCNEEPVNGDLKGMLSFSWGMFTGH